MLIVSDSVFRERQRLWREHEDAKLTDEVYYRQLLALCPDDFVGLVGLAGVFRDAGDPVSAERYCWQAIESNPCVSFPYLALAQLLYAQPESQALAIGLSEPGILKRLRNHDGEDTMGDVFLSLLESKSESLPAEPGEKLRELSSSDRAQMLALALRQNRDSEPGWVTARLRLLRLVEDLQDEAEMDAGTVENALGLLGETGTPAEIPCLLELVDLENDVASGASSWALGRIMDRLLEEAARFLESIIPSLRLPQRLKTAELIIANDRFDSENRLFQRLGEDLEVMEQDERDRYLPLLLVSMAANPRRGGVRTARAILRTQGAHVSRNARRECEELLSLFDGVDPPPRQAPPPAVTVYALCGVAGYERARFGREDATPGRQNPERPPGIGRTPEIR